jgi:aspartokinase-like uncharacterized kinase
MKPDMDRPVNSPKGVDAPRGLQATCVLKVGGSLLESPEIPDLALRVGACVRELGGPRPLLVVGGGPTVDCVRRWDRIFGLGEESAHWIAVRALSINAQVMAALDRSWAWVEDPEAVSSRWAEGRTPILDVFGFLKRVDEARADPLPRRWRVTSDSIAARAAEAYGAPRLVLLKSASVSEAATVASAVREGWVDGYFETASRRIPEILAVNLRRPGAAPARLRADA